MRATLVAACALAALVPADRRAHAAPFDDEVPVRAMKDELARALTLELPGFGRPYFVSYAMFDLHSVRVTASFGAIEHHDAYPQRSVDIDLRVGDYTFDNSNLASSFPPRTARLPLEDSYDAIRRDLWLQTDRVYKTAVEALDRKKAIAQQETKGPDDAAAFSHETPSHIVDEPAQSALELAPYDAVAKQVSAVFRTNPDIYESSVSILAARGRAYFLSSEGSASVEPYESLRIDIAAQTQANDGMPLHDAITLWFPRADAPLDVAPLVARAEQLAKGLSALRNAPVMEDYAGPVLFEGIAAAQVMRAVLADGFSGTPPAKDDRPGSRGFGESELVGKLGQPILPAGFSVVDDPTISTLGKSPMLAGERFDEEGVPTQKVMLVTDGVLKGFLMSRTPRKGFEHSNGHGSSSSSTTVRAFPTNLVFSSSKGISDAELRKRAIAAARAARVPYAVVVQALYEGRVDPEDLDLSSPDGVMPPAVVMKRLYTDGHEELVRGGKLGAIPLRSLKDLLAVGSSPTVYTYKSTGRPARMEMIFGSDSGTRISLAGPNLLFRDLDIKKPLGGHRNPPIVARPQ